MRLLVGFQNRPRGDFLGTLPVAAFLRGRLLDVLVLALFFGAHAAHVLLLRHCVPPSAGGAWHVPACTTFASLFGRSDGAEPGRAGHAPCRPNSLVRGGRGQPVPILPRGRVAY